MPFRTTLDYFQYGICIWQYFPSVYCVNDTTKSDYGKCYNMYCPKAVFVQTDTATYPTLQCETDGTCTRYTSTTWNRLLTVDVDYTSINKQLILLEFRSITHSSVYYDAIEIFRHAVMVSLRDDPFFELNWATMSYDAGNPRYGPYWKVQLNRYTPPPYTGMVVDMWMFPRFMLQRITIGITEANNNNMWYAALVKVMYSYEASPLAIIPLNYSDYITYADLRSAFGYAANGFDQPGWNADDMMRVLKEVFPDRTWAVFDDRTHTLYIYGLTMDDAISLGFVQRLSPTTVKVLDSNKKSDYTRFKEFYTKQIS